MCIIIVFIVLVMSLLWCIHTMMRKDDVIRSLAGENDKARNEIDRLTAEVESLNAIVSTGNKVLGEIYAKADDVIGEAREMAERHECDVEAVRGECDKTCDELTKSHERELAVIAEEHKRETDELKYKLQVCDNENTNLYLMLNLINGN